MLSEIKIGELFVCKKLLKIFCRFRHNSAFPCRYMDRGKYSLCEQHLQSKRQVLFTFGAIDELRVQVNNLPCRYTKGALP